MIIGPRLRRAPRRASGPPAAGRAQGRDRVVDVPRAGGRPRLPGSTPGHRGTGAAGAARRRRRRPARGAARAADPPARPRSPGATVRGRRAIRARAGRRAADAPARRGAGGGLGCPPRRCTRRAAAATSAAVAGLECQRVPYERSRATSSTGPQVTVSGDPYDFASEATTTAAPGSCPSQAKVPPPPRPNGSPRAPSRRPNRPTAIVSSTISRPPCAAATRPSSASGAGRPHPEHHPSVSTSGRGAGGRRERAGVVMGVRRHADRAGRRPRRGPPAERVRRLVDRHRAARAGQQVDQVPQRVQGRAVQHPGRRPDGRRHPRRRLRRARRLVHRRRPARRERRPGRQREPPRGGGRGTAQR